MLHAARVWMGVLLASVMAFCGVADAAEPSTNQIASVVLQKLKTKDQALLDAAIAKTLATDAKVLQNDALNALTSAADQAKVQALLKKQIESAALQQTLQSIESAQGFVQQAQLGPQLTDQLKQAGTTQLLTQTLNLQSYVTQSQASSSYVQGQAKVISGQATSTGGNSVKVLTVPGVLHVNAIWWPSDGTVQYTIVNDSGATLDYGGDFAGIPLEDSFTVANGATSEFGELSGLTNGDGSIANGASFGFQITPQPDAVDLPAQQVPYRGEAHVQVTLPGSIVLTLDLSAFEIAQNSGIAGSGGSALISGQAVASAL